MTKCTHGFECKKCRDAFYAQKQWEANNRVVDVNTIGKPTLTEREKALIDEAVKKTIKEYGKTLRRLKDE